MYICRATDICGGTYVCPSVSNNNILSVVFTFDRGSNGNIPPVFLELVFKNVFYNRDFLNLFQEFFFYFADGIVRCFSNNIVLSSAVIPW